MQAGDVRSAVQAYTMAIELLAVLAWHGLDQHTREHHLREWAGLSPDAATAAVAAGAPTTAIELLEAGRSILWAEAQQLRQDITVLRDRAPELVTQLETARAVLADPLPSASDSFGPSDAHEAQALEQDMLERRRQAAQAWDAAVGEVRRIGGFETFLRPVPFTDLQSAAADGPVVVVTVSIHGSHALIVTPDDVQVVDLADAPADTVLAMARTSLDAQERAWAARTPTSR